MSEMLRVWTPGDAVDRPILGDEDLRTIPRFVASVPESH